MGLDPGTKRVGVALTDGLQLTAQPHGVLDPTDPKFEQLLASMIDRYQVELIVVGLPVSLSGQEGPAAAAARRLANRVADATGLPVELWDERFTTRTAEAAMVEGRVRRRQRRAAVDKVAAAVMLQHYLDGRR